MKQNIINWLCFAAIFFSHADGFPWWIPITVSLLAGLILGTTNFSDGMDRAERIYHPERFQE